MPFQNSPVKNGTYRIKVFNQDLGIESVPKGESTAYTPWIRLEPLTDNKRQKWILTQSTETPGEWTIVSAFDSAGLVYKKTPEMYRGRGYPYPSGDSIQWRILDYGQYSKISTPSNGRDVFDSQYRSQGDNAVHFWQPLDQFEGPLQCFVFEEVQDAPSEGVKLDVVFIQDATGSQQPYINAAREQISQISAKLKEVGNFRRDDDLRFRFIAFRDHPPQETSFVVEENDFSSDIGALIGHLQRLFASGGGDGPEAQCDALDAALNSAWRNDAAKVVVLVTDSPPHGVEDDGDGFPDGCPSQNDPIRIVDLFAERGIMLNVVACEPALSGYYDNALDFYKGLVAKTPGGKIIPMGNTDAHQLQDAVVGLVVQALDNARLASKYGSKIRDLAQAQQAVNEVIADIHDELAKLGVQHYEVTPSDNVYLPNAQGEKNAKTWEEAKTLKDAKGKVRTTIGNRIVEELVLSHDFDITYKKTAITIDEVRAIVLKVLKAAGVDLGSKTASIFLNWIKVKVASISDALWYIGWRPPPAESQPAGQIPADTTLPSISPDVPPKPQPTVPAETKEPSVWALAIGVDEYQDNNMAQLSGCVADAEDFVDFLTKRMGVPVGHIKVLHNRDATRKAITSSIAALAKDDRIQNGDPIAIFYAGHGAEAHPPAGWSAGGRDARIQMICAYDFVPATTDEENGQGIPDITLSVLLSQLAEAKGNNITVIFDNCFSGSGTRTDQYTPNLFVRGVKLPEDYKVLDTVDQELLRKIPEQRRKVIISKAFEKTGAASHVLLAACSSQETSKEYFGRGRFTSALFSLLRSSAVDLSAVTYRDVISRLIDLPEQTPQCDGVYASRILFNGKIPNAGRILYRVTSEAGVVTLEAGEAQGITKGATFDVFNSEDIKAQPLGSVTAERSLACATIMNPGATPVPRLAWAVQTRVGEGADVAIALPVDSAVLPVLVRAVQEMQTRRPTKRNLRFVDIKNPPEHEVAVYNEGGDAVFELTDKAWTSEGLKRLSHTVPISQIDSLYTVFDRTADFFYHLRRSSKAQEAGRETDISENVSLAVYEVKNRYLDDNDPEAYGGPVPLPKLLNGKEVNLNRGGIIRIDVEEGRTIDYGLKLSSTLNQPLYVWAFAFNLSDLSITTIYQPTFAKRREKGTAEDPSRNNRQQADPSIPAYGSLTIGYGSGGARPLSLEIDDLDDVDVSYIKFFVTTEYVDLSTIEQRSPFDDMRKIVIKPSARQLFATLLVTVVGKKVKF